MTFAYNDRQLDYHFSLYNLTFVNERCVEIAIAYDWLSRVGGYEAGSMLEVGNVLGHYGCGIPRTIVDMVEKPEWYQNDPILNIDIHAHRRDPGYDAIVAISTVEHIGTDFQNDGTSITAIRHMQSLLNPGGVMLITAPTGISQVLDTAIIDGTTGARVSTTFDKVSRNEPIWIQDDEPTVRPYGADPVADLWARTVWIGEFYAD